MRILITGVAGFLGGHLVRLMAADHHITGVYHNKKPDFGPGIALFSSDDEIVGNFEAIVLCHAAVSAGSTVRAASDLEAANVSFTRKIIEKFPGIPVLYVSTVSVYEPCNNPIRENSAVAPQSPYAQTKLAGEHVVLEAEKSAIVRISSLYGNGMKDGTLIPTYAGQAIANQTIEVWGQGTRLQNYIHVDDVSRLIWSILANGVFSREIYLGTGTESHSNLEVANLIASYTASEILFVNQDNSQSAKYDNTLTRKAVNWQPQKSLEQGLREYIEWKKKKF